MPNRRIIVYFVYDSYNNNNASADAMRREAVLFDRLNLNISVITRVIACHMRIGEQRLAIVR